MRKFFKGLRCHKPSLEHLAVPPEIPPRPSTTPPSIDADPGPSNIAPEGFKNQESSLILGDGRNQESHIPDDVTPAQERDGDQEIPLNVSHEPFIPNVPSKREPEAQNQREDYQQEAGVERPTGMPSERASGDAPDPIQPDGPELAHGVSGDRVVGEIALPVDEETEGFTSLKTLLSVIYVHYKEVLSVGSKIENLIPRITALEECFNSKPSDVPEQRRRYNVIERFEAIKSQLRSYWESGSQQPANTDDISERLEALRETLFDYQMKKQNKIYVQECQNIPSDEAAILNGFRSALGVEFGHGDRKGCLKGTRGTVLDEIENWVRDHTAPQVYWLNGLAGTGKTTIAQTTAEIFFADGQLGASFFCSRDYQDRRDLHFIFPTLAVQLARKYPDFRSHFVRLVRSDPGIAHGSLYNQMNQLIVGPLKEFDISTVIVIDALDECIDEEPASAILSVLGRLISEIPKVKFLVTGRPEPRIQAGFRLPLMAEVTDVFVLHEVERSEVQKDIRLFFNHNFSELVRRLPVLGGWPTGKQLDLLCKRTEGLFVYAVATVKFIDKQNADPSEQLDLLLQSPDNSSREAKTKFNTNSTLDLLYISILQGAFGDSNDPDVDPRVRSVLGVVVLAASPLSPSAIAMILGLRLQSVFRLLSSAQSLLILQDDVNCPVRPFHKSFPDFIVDPDRCTSQRFHISPPHHHPQLLTGCLNLMYQTLEKNMCKLPDEVANSDVGDLKERVELHLNPALQYACKSWHTHFVGMHETSISAPEVTFALHRFLETKFLFWLDVLSVLGAVRNAVVALQTVVGRLEASPTLDLAYDCSRFVSISFEIISLSSPHIYHSALALAPETSIVRKLYELQAQPLVRIVYGLPVSWDYPIATAMCPSYIRLVTWSPCNRFIAISHGLSLEVEVLDSVTLQRLQRLKFSGDKGSPQTLVFSPDSRLLTISHTGRWLVVSWDLLTGGVAGAIQHSFPSRDQKDSEFITYSTNGTMIAILRTNFRRRSILSIYDGVRHKHMHDTHLPGEDATGGLWTHGESLRLAAFNATTAGHKSVTVWEVGFTAGATMTAVATLSVPWGVTFLIPDNLCIPQSTIYPPSPSAPLPVAHTSDRDGALVWDARNSKILIRHSDVTPHGRFDSMTFSSDGRFVAGAKRSGVHIWKYSTTGYVLHGKLVTNGLTEGSTPRFSPNGESVISSWRPTIGLWHMKNLTAPISNTFIDPPDNFGRFLVEILPDRSLAAVMRHGDGIVTLLDIRSGAPQLTIDTGMRGRGLGLMEDAVVVVGDGKATTWELPGRTSLRGATMNVEDSTRTIVLPEPWRAGHVLISPDFRYIFVEKNYKQYHIHSATTGEFFGKFSPGVRHIWFALDGHHIGELPFDNKADVWKITAEGTVELSARGVDIDEGRWGCPYIPPRGYRIADDGWVFGPRGRRLLILPPLWRAQTIAREDKWSGQFLGLLLGVLPKPVIIDLEP